jgi:hypothetical protein
MIVVPWRASLPISAAANPGAALAIMKMNSEIDVRHILPAIRVPTLILHRTAEHVIDVEQARYMAKHIPAAKLVELPGEDHVPWFGDQDSILDEVEQFLTGGPTRANRNGCLLPCYLRISRVRRHWPRHLATIVGENCLRRFMPGGVMSYISTAVVKLTHQGDGFLATFDGPARAVRCASAIRDMVRSLNLEVRCGLHTGECEIVGKDIAGIAVHTGARVAALAAPGEVLVSQTVRDLVAGSGLILEEYGTYTLKRVPNEWRLFRAAD